MKVPSANFADFPNGTLPASSGNVSSAIGINERSNGAVQKDKICNIYFMCTSSCIFVCMSLAIRFA